MKSFYFTLGKNHMFRDKQHLDKHYVKVCADTQEEARAKFIVEFAIPYMGGADQYSWDYTESQFKHLKPFHVLGKFMEIGCSYTIIGTLLFK